MASMPFFISSILPVLPECFVCQKEAHIANNSSNLHELTSSRQLTHIGVIQVFEDTKHLVQSAVDGYNVCIFAYGQTGSGKTFTIYGTDDNPGITIPTCSGTSTSATLHNIHLTTQLCNGRPSSLKHVLELLATHSNMFQMHQA